MASGKSKGRRSGVLKTLLLGLGLLVGAFVFKWRYPAPFDLAELKGSDLRLYAHHPPQPLSAVAIAAVDDKSIAELGRWPWPRSVMARLLDALADYRVAVVGFDMIFSERDSADVANDAVAARLKVVGLSPEQIRATLGAENDPAFAAALARQGSAYLGLAFESHELAGSQRIVASGGFLKSIVGAPPLGFGLVREQPGASGRIISAQAYLPPLPTLARAARGIAFVDSDADADGVVRSELTAIRFHGRYCVPLYLAVVSAYMHGAPLGLTLAPFGVAAVTLGRTEVPVDELGRMFVYFRGPEGTFPRYPVSDIIARRLPPAALADKIVLVGTTARALGDRLVTPVGGYYPGVEIHANAIDDVLSGTFIRRSALTLAEEHLAALVLASGVILAVAFTSALWSMVAVVAMGAAYVGYAQYRLEREGALIGIAFPLITLVLVYMLLASDRYLAEWRGRRKLRHAFEHYLHPDVISTLVDEPGGLRLGGERRHLSIMFADIRNFTTRAERSDPEALVALLNDYMTVMTDLILERGGVVDKLMGDGIMAFWGAPVASDNPARGALGCGLAMLGELARLRKQDPRFADIDIGVGIATGEAVVGNFGGERRFDYSVIGDTVNLASRLEGLTRYFDVRLLATRETLAEAGDGFVARELGNVRVKGKQRSVQIVEVAGHEGDGFEPGFYRRFSGALAMLREGAAADAVGALRELAKERPEDRPTTLCLEKLAAAGVAPTEMLFEFETK